MNKYIILGIHGEDVFTVQENVARVRMFVGDKEIDEDFNLPVIPESVPKTQEVYDFFLKDVINKRMEELANG